MTAAETQSKITDRRKRTERRKWFICMLVLVFLAAVAGYRYHGWMLQSADGLMPADDMENSETAIAVHVKGAVENPGVYYFALDQRVIDAVNAAVPAADADLESLNLAAYLVDGSQLVVPAKGDAKSSTVYTPAASDPSYLGNSSTNPPAENVFPGAESGTQINEMAMVNINTADSAMLQTLQGIGAAKAEAIIQYRTVHGVFTSTDQLMQVSGIGNSTYENIRTQICI